MDEIPSFGAWLRRRRKALDLTQDALARRVGYSVSAIRKLEADEYRPSREIAEHLADALGIAPEERAAFVHFARVGLDAEGTSVRLPVAAPSMPPASARAPAERVAQPVPEDTARALPTGTVTFLFTDIEGSTRLWEQQPQAMPTALARHDAILRAAIAERAGVVFRTEGDAVCAAFARAPDAFLAALEAQQALHAEPWGPTGPIHVRMALHTGPVEVAGDDYQGLTLSRIARLVAAGHGGQILISRATHELVRERLPPGVVLRDLGAHWLKDLTHPEQIFQVVAPGLPVEFPPLRTLDIHPHNLPPQPTPFVGREEELALIATHLHDSACRLVTVIGPGGIGKTRLALEAAAARRPDFPDGVYFVPLAALSSGSLLVSTIADALAFPLYGGADPEAQLLSFLRERRLLLVLDNFEHLLEGTRLLAQILDHAPGGEAAGHFAGAAEPAGGVVDSPPGLAIPAR
jgi:class 3 adenylate cyclase/DNA-binding XRE family transcriptional regulator